MHLFLHVKRKNRKTEKLEKKFFKRSNSKMIIPFIILCTVYFRTTLNRPFFLGGVEI
ncbi:uncharacterized protein RHIMIDRAFT_140380 [Rhizopus microsporus ATCC 52813]|uniref:Uncharacterized protein n=1 Tax=Rhizopus microsporus ATCC 52813 TaxID=1340429 RepID=A0A2G4STK4_RHIZD|nr:uncharacterized protein RHIMIDRAFT_140380 [Rhizopus microsporus ATCC 52813]PHZ12118.1 hypothetical protein RHIMIDRAFT_140380 [Rhizopus microsporus ATCC 52813]